MVLVVLVVVALMALRLAPYDPNEIHADQAPPTRQYLFGTDEVGRDILSRVIYSSRPVGAGVVTVSWLHSSARSPASSGVPRAPSTRSS